MKKFLLFSFACCFVPLLAFAQTERHVSTLTDLHSALQSSDTLRVILDADLTGSNCIAGYPYTADTRNVRGIKILDLNGHTVDASAYLLTYTTDSDQITITGNGTWNATGPYAFHLGGGTYQPRVAGKLIIENGTFNYNDSYAFFWMGNDNLTEAQVEINGGTFHLGLNLNSSYAKFIYIRGAYQVGRFKPKFVLNDCLVLHNGNTGMFSNGGGANATVTINGGTFYEKYASLQSAFKDANIQIGSGKRAYIGGQLHSGSTLDYSDDKLIRYRLLQVGNSEDFVTVTLTTTPGGFCGLNVATYDSYMPTTAQVLKQTPVNLEVKAVPDKNIAFNGWANVSNTELSRLTDAIASFAVSNKDITMKSYFGSAQPPKDHTISVPDALPAYYSDLNDQSADSLVPRISRLIRNKYDGVVYGSGNCTHCLWEAFTTTDIYPNDYNNVSLRNKIWNMYGYCGFDTTDHGSYATAECEGYNRGYAVPKTWMGISSNQLNNTYTGAGTDLFHIYPADVKVNSERADNPFGEVVYPTITYMNESKLGPCAWPNGYNGMVYEPADEYKGDFARSLMYMAIGWGYSDEVTINQNKGGIVFNEQYDAEHRYGLTDYGVELLMRWHAQDPVSKKEIDRNNAVEKIQGNRNPFIDYPELADYIWGNHQGLFFPLTNAGTIATYDADYDPESGEMDGTTPYIKVVSNLIFEDTPNEAPTNKKLLWEGKNLTEGVSFKLSGEDASKFGLGYDSIPAGNANGSHEMDIDFNPSGEVHLNRAVLTITSGDVEETVTIMGWNRASHRVTWVVNSEVYATTVVADGSPVVMPSDPEDYPSCYSSKRFAGWADMEALEEETEGDLATATVRSKLFNKSTDEDKLPVIEADNDTFRAVYGNANEEVVNDTVVFDQNAFAGQGKSGSGSYISTTIGDVTVSSNKGYGASTEIRIYEGGTLTIASTQNFKEIKFTSASGYPVTKFTIPDGEGKFEEGIWTGSLSSITFTNNSTSQIQINQIDVIFSDEHVTYDAFITDCQTFAVPFVQKCTSYYDDLREAYVDTCDTVSVQYVKYGTKPIYPEIYLPDYKDPYTNYLIHSFIGWKYSDPDILYNEGDELPEITQVDIAFTAQYRDIYDNFVVEFEGYPELKQYVSADPMMDLEQKKISRPDVTPTKSGYTFFGWTTDPSQTITPMESDTAMLFDFAGQAVDNDMILYQVWLAGDADFKVECYVPTLIDSANGGSVSPDNTSWILFSSDTVQGKTGHGMSEYKIPPTLNGFSLIKDNSSENISPEGTSTLTAYYKRERYKLSWDINGGTETATSHPTTDSVYYGAKFSIPQVEKTGYYISWWKVDTLKEKHAITFTAQWASRTDMTYTVKHFKQQIDGTYSDTPDSIATYTDGVTDSMVTLVAMNTSVSPWLGFDAPSGAELLQTIRPDVSENVFELNYPRHQHTITWDANGGSLSGIDPATYTTGHENAGLVYYETPILFPDTDLMTPPPGRVFQKWNRSDEHFNGTMPDNDITFTAQWGKPFYDVQFVVKNVDESDTTSIEELEEGVLIEIDWGENNGSWEPSTLVAQGEEGWQASVSVQNRTWVFDHFDGALSGTDKTAQLTMPDSNIVVTVYVRKLIYHVRVSVNDSSAGTAMVSGNTEFAIEPWMIEFNNDSILAKVDFFLQFIAVPKKGYKFDGWISPLLIDSTDESVSTAEKVLLFYQQLYDTMLHLPESERDPHWGVSTGILGKLFNDTAVFNAIDYVYGAGIMFYVDESDFSIVLQAMFSKEEIDNPFYTVTFDIKKSDGSALTEADLADITLSLDWGENAGQWDASRRQGQGQEGWTASLSFTSQKWQVDHYVGDVDTTDSQVRFTVQGRDVTIEIYVKATDEGGGGDDDDDKTAIDVLKEKRPSVRKQIIDGHLYIIVPDGTRYDAKGIAAP